MIALKLNVKIIFLLTGIFIGIILLFIGFIGGFLILPKIIENHILDSKVLRENSEQWKMFLETPFPLDFKVYLFTIENPSEILLGEKPIVKEQGPYIYKLYKWKEDIYWNNVTNEISYYEYEKYEFDELASGNLSEFDKVTVLNAPFLSFLYTAESSKSTSNYLPMINEALEFIFEEFNSPFIYNITVKKLLFDGVPFCKNASTANGLIAKIACFQIKNRLNLTKQMRMENNKILYSIFNYRNNSHQGYFTIQSGLTNKYDKIGKITKLNGNNSISLSRWKNDKEQCNKINGLTSIFPINLNAKITFDVFSEDLCRTIKFSFSKLEKFPNSPIKKGYQFNTLKFTENPCYSDVNNNNEINNDDGILNLLNCQGAPVFASFPHFLYANQKYLMNIKGLNPPNETKHEMFLTLEELSGTPLKVAKRIQFNLFLKSVRNITILENLADDQKTLIPLFWIEESFHLPDKYQEIITNKLYKNIFILDIVRYSILGIACLLIIACILVFTYFY